MGLSLNYREIVLELTGNVWLSQENIVSLCLCDWDQSSHETDLDCEMTSVDVYTEVNMCSGTSK